MAKIHCQTHADVLTNVHLDNESKQLRDELKAFKEFLAKERKGEGASWKHNEDSLEGCCSHQGKKRSTVSRPDINDALIEKFAVASVHFGTDVDAAARYGWMCGREKLMLSIIARDGREIISGFAKDRAGLASIIRRKCAAKIAPVERVLSRVKCEVCETGGWSE